MLKDAHPGALKQTIGFVKRWEKTDGFLANCYHI